MTHEPTDADLVHLADGSLPDAQADALRARVGASPELRARLREQERAIALTRATEQISAPRSVHDAVRARTVPRPRRTLTWTLAPLGGVAVAAVVVVIVLLTASAGSLTVGRTGHLALAAATRAAPALNRSDTDLLNLSVGSIAFPSYARIPAWRATGARTDEIAGRRVQTVFYDIAGERLGYSIVPGPALRVPHGHRQTIGGVRYVTTAAASGSGQLVTWRRDGHTCVVAGRQASRGTLLRLATAAQATA